MTIKGWTTIGILLLLTLSSGCVSLLGRGEDLCSSTFTITMTEEELDTLSEETLRLIFIFNSEREIKCLGEAYGSK